MRQRGSYASLKLHNQKVWNVFCLVVNSVTDRITSVRQRRSYASPDLPYTIKRFKNVFCVVVNSVTGRKSRLLPDLPENTKLHENIFCLVVNVRIYSV